MAAKQGANFDHMYKIALVGDSGVGKSNLLSRFAKNIFEPNEKSTIGVEFATRIVEMPDGKHVQAQIWDTAGQERYRAITNAYYRGALGAVLVYSVTDRASFNNIPRWFRELREYANADVVLLLLGNKVDLIDQGYDREVSYEEGRQAAEEFGLIFMETSALSGINVDTGFTTLLQFIHKQTTIKATAAVEKEKERVDLHSSMHTNGNNGGKPGCCN